MHRLLFDQSAMADLLIEDYSLVEKNALYRCLDKLLAHKAALFDHLRARWQEVVVLKDCVTETKETPWASNVSTSLAKSASVSLALDVRLGRLTLSVEGIEVLLKPLVSRDARVDRTSQAPLGRQILHRCGFPSDAACAVVAPALASPFRRSLP